MSYLVLARKWRPEVFTDLIGQKPIVRILGNALKQDKMAHAYVFSGPRGVGKTSVARILAKALNCKDGPTPSPCGQCPSCIAITGGHSVDVTEIDGASNNSVDDVRDLRERVKYAPAGGKSKVYIIDEVHMLSTSAFNALLKTLEEPPPHVVFVLATTEPRKIPLTVMSRCQHLPFRRISFADIKARLSHITGSEGIKVTDTALNLIARAADGSIRDSLTILDQVASFAEEITDDDVMDLLGMADMEGLAVLAGALVEGDREAILRTVAELVERGTDLRAFARDLVKFFRDVLVMKLTKKPEEALDVGAEELAAIGKCATGVSIEHLSLLIPELIAAESGVKASFSPRIALEMALVKTSFLSMYRPVSEAIAALAGHGPDIPAPAGNPAAVADTPKPKEPKAVAEVADTPEPEEPEEEIADEPTPEEPGAEVQDTPPEPAPMATGGSLDAGKLMGQLVNQMERTEGPKVSVKLASARAELKEGVLTLVFAATDEMLCADPLREKLGIISEIATRIAGAEVRAEIKVLKREAATGNDIKKKAMQTPAVKDALELFDGRVVDVRKSRENDKR